MSFRASGISRGVERPCADRRENSGHERADTEPEAVLRGAREGQNRHSDSGVKMLSGDPPTLIPDCGDRRKVCAVTGGGGSGTTP